MKTNRLYTGLFLLGLSMLIAGKRANAQTIYWTDIATSKIQRAKLIGGLGVEDLVTTGQVFTPVDIVLDTTSGKMYWTEASPADFMIGRANLDGTDVGYMIEGLISPSGIALDTDGGKIYWTDIGSGKIQRANLDGNLIEDLVVDGVITPMDLALDVGGGKLYWTEASPADFMISRANLDGTNVEGLVTGLSNPSGIALDLSNGKIYWADRSASKIQRANLDGSQVEDIVTSGLKEPARIALDVTAGKIYWTEASPADFMISRANLDGTDREFLITGLTSPSGISLELLLGPGSIPTVSGWGFVAMILALLTVGTLILAPRRRTKSAFLE